MVDADFQVETTPTLRWCEAVSSTGRARYNHLEAACVFVHGGSVTAMMTTVTTKNSLRRWDWRQLAFMKLTARETNTEVMARCIS